MNTNLCEPTVELVKTACDKFDHENDVVEGALSELFAMFPANTDIRHVLLKVVTLNRLYSTQIFAVMDVAIHIHSNASNIDVALASGLPEIVDKIARVTIQGKERSFFSFATKYCSWHNPESYPIYDSHVDKYLRKLQKRKPFASFFKRNADIRVYPVFRKVMVAFRDFYDLGSFSFKDLDKFLWLYGGESPVEKTDQPAAGVDISLTP